MLLYLWGCMMLLAKDSNCGEEAPQITDLLKFYLFLQTAYLM